MAESVFERLKKKKAAQEEAEKQKTTKDSNVEDVAPDTLEEIKSEDIPQEEPKEEVESEDVPKKEETSTTNKLKELAEKREKKATSAATKEEPVKKEKSETETKEPVEEAEEPVQGDDLVITERAGFIMVEKVYKKSGEVVAEDHKQEMIPVRNFTGPVATVGVNMKMTVNLGDYESATCSVSVSVPTYLEEADDAYEFVKKFAGEKMGKEVIEMKKLRK